MKSPSGYLFKLFEKCTISWNTKRQKSVAASSTEAQYMALFEAIREALCLKSSAKSGNLHTLELLREQIEREVIKLNYISTGNQQPDILTKPVSSVTFTS